jgi:D-glycero-alpha-D-manno-heptose-7-phosphate kinase
MRREIIDWGANLEARSLGIPTGKQDYFAAVYGGIGAIWFDTRGERREGLALSGEFLRELEGRLILIFTGISHFSGTNNWNMMKRYIDGKGDTVERMRGIRDTAFRVRESLLSEDMEAFARGISIEWENRKGLARGVTTRRIDRLVDFLADEGATASKICGAGGGGCLLSLAGKGRKEKIVAALKERGYMVMDFHLDHRGVSEADEPAGALRAPS